MDENSVKNIEEQKEIGIQECKIKLHASSVASTVAFALAIVVLILEIIFSNTAMVYGFICFSMCFVMSGVEKWLEYFSLKNKNDLYSALIDSAAFLACVLFVVLAII